MPKQWGARSRYERRVSITICRASRRSLRMARFAPWSGGHLAGCLYQAFARSAASDKMRGKPPLPLRIERAGLSRGRLGEWPQRFPVASLILLPYCYPEKRAKKNCLQENFACKHLILWSRLPGLNWQSSDYESDALPIEPRRRREISLSC